MPAPTLAYWTADQARRLPDDGKRYEVVHGELLVTPAPRVRHQEIVRELTLALGNYLRRHPVATLLTSPADISWGPDTLLQPDLFAFPTAERATGRWEDIRTLLLVIEVLSPATAHHDRFQKRRRYQEAGVPLYWIVDPDNQLVEVWTPADLFPRIEKERLEWRPEGAREGCVIELAAVFGARGGSGGLRDGATGPTDASRG